MRKYEDAKYLIYALVDPRSLLVHYIGRSSSGFARPRRHRNKRSLDTNTRCATWIKSLLHAGMDFNIAILETVAASEKLNQAERWWIAYGLLSDWPLTNHTLGGEGYFLVKHSPESCAGRSAKLRDRVFSKEHRARISKAKRGVPKSEEHKLKISKVVTLLWEDAELRQRQRASHLGKRHTPEQTAKVVAANKGSKRSAEARANLSAGQHHYNQRLRKAGTKHPLAGKKRPPETVAKISKALRKHFAVKKSV